MAIDGPHGGVSARMLVRGLTAASMMRTLRALTFWKENNPGWKENNPGWKENTPGTSDPSQRMGCFHALWVGADGENLSRHP